MAGSSSSLLFTVMRKEARLVVPAAELTPPREQKQLSDIDDQGGLRFQIPVIIFYKNNPFMEGKDPVSVIKEALAKALVVYYPFAGRLIERPNGKLVVDCTSEGILFVEADADIELDRLGDMIRPGCPFMEELLHHVPGSDGILGCPLLLVQVTRFRCGGFSFAVRVNHTMSDATGLVQFFKAIAEFVQGKETALSVPPIWQRELLSARQPPRITCRHHEYEQVPNINDGDINTNTFQKSFFFGPKEIRAIRNHLPPHSRSTTFEALTACLWRCRTRALTLDPNDTVRVSSLVNGRGLRGLLVPLGYYGNVIAYPAAVSKAGKLCTFSLQYAVELVKMAKAQMSDEEYLRSVADLMVIKGRPSHPVAGTFIVSDLRNLGFDTVDFGWGKPVYGGVTKAVSLISFYMSFKDGIVVPISLPQPVMEKFEEELNKMIEDPLDGSHAQWPSKIKSML